MKKIILVLGIISIFLLTKKSDYYVIPNEAIRFRIIPNSNNPQDILMKETLLANLTPEIKNIGTSDSIKDSRNNINNSKSNISKIIDSTFKENNYKMKYDINYGLNYFPEKTYKGIKYEEGYYESLIIKVGESKGDNFWCVMFPPLCMIDEKSEPKEYKSFIKELVDKLLK